MVAGATVATSRSLREADQGYLFGKNLNLARSFNFNKESGGTTIVLWDHE